MNLAIKVNNLSKTYSDGFKALENINLEIKQQEIIALLGPNGAGKTTLISIICGLLRSSSGSVSASGYDIVKDYKKARQEIGLVPQELTLDAFETVLDTVNFSRGLFGLKKDPKLIEVILKSLSIWDKRNNQLLSLSGGMKRRVMIAKALAHEPKILFLDEPTAGVDVKLRKDMWELVARLRSNGVTIVLTTHYIEEAEEMADRVAIINKGKIVLIDEKDNLMKKLGSKQIEFILKNPLHSIPENMHSYNLVQGNKSVKYTYNKECEHDLGELFLHFKENNLECVDIITKESSLEEIFVNLVENKS